MTIDGSEREVLEHRARELARPLGEPATTGSLEVLVVTLDGERYGLPSGHVRELLPSLAFRRLPAGTGLLRGVVPARGDVVPVADLADLLDRPSGEPPRAYVVVLDGHEDPVGLLVDEATEVRHVPAEVLRAADDRPTLELGVSDGVVVLDAIRLLADPRLAAPTRRATAALPDQSQPPTPQES